MIKVFEESLPAKLNTILNLKFNLLIDTLIFNYYYYYF